METKIRILLADANADFRHSMTDLISREGDMEVAAAVDNGMDALSLAEELKPDVLLTDLVLLKLDGLMRKVALRDILYLESRNKKVAIHTTEGAHEIRRSMETMEAALGDGFYRCHRCYLVNLARIADYGPRTIRLESGEHLMLAEKKYADFVKRYLSYAKNGGVVRV